MKTWKIAVGEIEHSGDIDLTLSQIQSTGATNVRCETANFDEENGIFTFEHEITDRYEMSMKLQAAEICL